MNRDGQLQITVGGEPWVPAATLADCGPDDPCYVVRVADDGSASLAFGDGVTGRRPPDGARIGVIYRRGAGDDGSSAGDGGSSDPAVALVDVMAQVGDVLSQYQDEVAAEAYLETDARRTSVAGANDLRLALAGRLVDVRVCLCMRPVRRLEDAAGE